jgi:hypothetical protein
MTDPERLSRRGGFAAELLRAGADEQPGEAGVTRTLAALGLSGAVLTTTAAASGAGATSLASSISSGAALSAGAAGGGASGVVSAALLVKWVGVGVVGGMSLAGAAAVMTRPAPPPSAVVARAGHTVVAPSASASASRPALPVVVEAPRSREPSQVAHEPPPRVGSVAAPSLRATSEEALGMPLAAEVLFVDRGRALLRAGRTLEGLAALERYEQEFSEARLLPEVLFLRLEGNERLGRTREARGFAERLASGFPQSPHAARARQLLGE